MRVDPGLSCTMKVKMGFEIRKAKTSDIAPLASIISEAFEDEAWRLGITAQSNPAHPSNCSPERLLQEMNRGISFYILEDKGRPCGCVGLDTVSDEVCRLDKLAVLPPDQQRGLGTALVRHALSEAGQMKLFRVQASISDDDQHLHDWLEKLGFEDTPQKALPHLVFPVSLMTYYCL